MASSKKLNSVKKVEKTESNRIKNKFTPYIKSKLNEKASIVSNPIFVFIGVEQYVNISEFSEYLVDEKTFYKNGNGDLFSKSWFFDVFSILNMGINNKNFFILSFAQFSYLLKYLSPNYFDNRIILVSDGLRNLLPLSKDDYIKKITQDNFEERDDKMPSYMAEQFEFGDIYLYSIKKPVEDFEHIKIFEERKPLDRLSIFDSNNYDIIDVGIDTYGLELFINKCLKEDKFDTKIVIRIFNKQPIGKYIRRHIEVLNWLLDQFGGQIYELENEDIIQDVDLSVETTKLLKQYWGEDAEFRNINVYKNPDYDKEIITISQGIIVETIIKEYKKAKNSRDFRDLFLTAPTGSGKSLLFQLPAFYISQQRDVVIVISPLIALMRDQVTQIHNERQFDKVYFINSELSFLDRNKVIENCIKGEIDILYISPELFLSYDITYFIGKERHIGLIVIDEVHLVTTWGRDFRLDYWFLGQHISKLRKNINYCFPMVALTATAVYGGDNDIVFNSVNSLYMHNPYIFIGEIKRDNITFLINNHEEYGSKINKEKENETISFIKDIIKLNIKTIIYAPFRRHVDGIIDKLKEEEDKKYNSVVGYHSGFSMESKNFAYENFKKNLTKVMIATKAFGMGVDISDIQLVYHYAPSGLLSDYIQEIGRAARKKDIQGFAAINYATGDLMYSKQLHYISSLRNYQIREVIKKIYELFISNKKKRNLLISSGDFCHIFSDQNCEQKVMSALIMIEKDYLAKFRFNVIIARPKKFFVNVYCRMNKIGYEILNKENSNNLQILKEINNDLIIVKLNLEKIWQKKFSDESFPMIKQKFYKGTLFLEDEIICKPQVKVIFSLSVDLKQAQSTLEKTLDNLQNTLARLSGHFFSFEDISEEMKEYISDKKKREKLISFILTTCSGTLLSPGKIENDAFLQRRKINEEEKYRVFGVLYVNIFAGLKRRMKKIIEQSIKYSTCVYVSYNSDNLLSYIRLGCLLEILDIGTYESSGGDNPMIFIRINDPRRIRIDAKNSDYKNIILENVEKTFQENSEIFDYFLLHSFTNEERWNFIEDFFLGNSIESLITNHHSNEENNIDIVSYLEEHSGALENKVDYNKNNVKNIFEPEDGRIYYSKDLITINDKTHTVEKWLAVNPVDLDKARQEYKFELTPQLFTILISKLREHHFLYYRDAIRLNIKIEFPGYSQPIIAKIPYTDEPIKFYTWWCKNEDKVSMNKKELIELLIKVHELNSKVIKVKHKDILRKINILS